MADPPVWTPYCGAAPAPGAWLDRWNLDPLLLAALLGLVAVFHLRREADRPVRPGAFWPAFGLLALLFVSPLCALSSALFSVRVTHHVLLAAVVAPLLVWSAPRERWPAAGPLAAATAVHAAVFWAWHAPGVYAWALSHDWAYWLMQAALLGSALAFWIAVRRAAAPAAAAALLATTVQMGLLGALITFSATPLYAPHLASTPAWGFTPLEDQQLGGLIMWAPAAALYLGAALLLFGRWLAGEGRPAAIAS